MQTNWFKLILLTMMFAVIIDKFLIILNRLLCTGKCYPYDPNRLKGVNLEAKPGMIIQAAPTPSNQKTTTTPYKGQQGHPKGQKGVHTDSYSGSKGDKGQATSTTKPGEAEFVVKTGFYHIFVIIFSPIIFSLVFCKSTNLYSYFSNHVYSI